MKSFPTCINLNYKIQNCFPESESNAYIPSIQRLLSLLSLSSSSQGCRSPFKRLFPESEDNAYIPSIQRHFPLLPLSHLKAVGALLKDSSPSQRAMLTSQAFRDTFPLLSLSLLKAAGAILKDSPCSFSPSGYATAHNCPELLAQPPTT